MICEHLHREAGDENHTAASGTCCFLKGLCSTSEVDYFFTAVGESTLAAQRAGERSCSHFSICIPRRFCLILVSWDSEGRNPSRAHPAGCCSASGRKWVKRWSPE